MDPQQFDHLTRAMARETSRRDALRLIGRGSVAAGLLVLLGSGSAAAAQPCVRGGKKCKQHRECCSGVCRPDGVCANCPPPSFAPGDDFVRCVCGDGTELVYCANIPDCGFSTEVDAICGPACCENGGLQATACLHPGQGNTTCAP
jgi:hypothetical protein